MTIVFISLNCVFLFWLGAAGCSSVVCAPSVAYAQDHLSHPASSFLDSLAACAGFQDDTAILHQPGNEKVVEVFGGGRMPVGGDGVHAGMSLDDIRHRDAKLVAEA